MEPGEVRDAYTVVIANQMKRQFLVWNRDTVPDPLILKDLGEMSKGKLKLPADTQLTATAELLRVNQTGPKNEVDTRKRHNSGGGGGKKRNRNRKKRY
jgi:hypothetical protein